ncbi:MAG: pyridoxamine 5'-phosphate oxidase family protein [Deltaproteobacteria bacterium]|nr:pyridoxamine 5'-phosphate oxidase family protein [Deltaproteobacteria bacterium]
MAKIKQPKAPSFVLPVFKQTGVKIKKFESSAAFEKVLMKFLKRNNVLHLSTSRNNIPRTTPIEYRLDGFTFYMLSEGGSKFNNLKVNNTVSFSIAETYHPEKDFWGAKGLQAWGKAKVYSKKSAPGRFENALKKMKVYESLKKMGQNELPPQINFRVIEITPDRMNYGNVREGVYNVTWERK